MVKKKGTGFPGNCCDLYECKPLVQEKDLDCVVDDIIYEDGEEWYTDDKQQCKCKNGISLCTTKVEEVTASSGFIRPIYTLIIVLAPASKLLGRGSDVQAQRNLAKRPRLHLLHLRKRRTQVHKPLLRLQREPDQRKRFVTLFSGKESLCPSPDLD